MAGPAHKTEYFIIENSNLQKKANTAAIIFTNYITEELKLKIIDAFYLSDGYGIEQVIFKIDNSAHYKYTAKRHGLF